MNAKPIDLSNAGVFDLVQLYLLAIVAALKADGLGAALQEAGPGAGRLWIMPSETTVPVASLDFKFGEDDVALKVTTRDERVDAKVVKYAEGIDGYLQSLQKFMRAGLLEAPKGAARRSLKSV